MRLDPGSARKGDRSSTRRVVRRRKMVREILAAIDPHVQQERLFVECYLASGNGAEAMARAGYEETSGWRHLLNKSSVSEYLAERRATLVQQTQVTAERILAEMTVIAMQNVADYTRLNEHGERVVDLTATPDYKLAALGAIEVDVTAARLDPETGAELAPEVRSTRIKLVGNKRDALLDLGKRLGVFERDAAPREFEFTLKLGTATIGESQAMAGAEVTVRVGGAQAEQAPNDDDE